MLSVDPSFSSPAQTLSTLWNSFNSKDSNKFIDSFSKSPETVVIGTSPTTCYIRKECDFERIIRFGFSQVSWQRAESKTLSQVVDEKIASIIQNVLITMSEGGREFKILARYSITLQKEQDGVWKIVHSHLSEGVSPTLITAVCQYD